MQDVTVLDLVGGRQVPHRTVLIDGSRVSVVGPSATTAIPRGARVVSASGMYLIPGLWDMHVHIAAREYLPLLVANGVTGVRDMGGAATAVTDGCESIGQDSLRAWSALVEAGELIGPGVVTSGPPASGSGWPTSLAARTPAEARAAVRSAETIGVDFLKVYDGIPPPAYEAMADEANARGLVFAGHVPEEVSLARAIELGHRSVEHIRDALLLCFTTDSLELREFFEADRWSDEDVTWGTERHSECASVVEALRTRESWLTPTLVVERSKIAVEEAAFRNDPRRSHLPGAVQEAFADYALRKTVEDSVARRSDHLWWRTQQRLVQRMYKEGARMLAGSDAACQGGVPGFSLHEELRLLVEAGLSPLAALRAATTEPARYFAAEDSLGSIEAGKVADLVLLSRDPLTDIDNVQAIEAVIVRGRLLDKEALSLLYAIRPPP